jgi:hypothetical protein
LNRQAEETAMDTPSKETTDLFCRALGEAVIKLWSRMPADIQQGLFEAALASEREELRAELAQFLHHKHARTSAGVAARAIAEPDSLGG